MQSRSHLFWKIIFLLIVAILNTACARQVIIPLDPSTQRILSAVSTTVSENDILSAVAGIDLMTPGGYYPTRAVLILKKPSYLRLELLPLMGPPDFFLATTPEAMKIILPAKREFYQGEPTGRNLSKFLPCQLNIEDIVAIFAGAYPLLTGDVIYLRYPEENNLRIEMKSSSGIAQTVWINSNGRLSKLSRFDKSGNLLYNAEFTDYDEGRTIASKITVTMADSATSITVKYSGLKIETARDLSIFDLPVPSGFKTINIDK